MEKTIKPPKDKRVEKILEELVEKCYLCEGGDCLNCGQKAINIDQACREIEALMEEINLKSYARLDGWNKANKKIIELQALMPKRLGEIIEWAAKQFSRIKLCHMDCDCPQSEHDMFHLADEGVQKLRNYKAQESK